MNDKNRNLIEQFMRLHGLLIRQFHQSHRMAHTPYSGQGRVLKFLKLKPEFPQKELAELLGMRPQSLGELLMKLEKNGYVTRAPSEADRRVVIVRLTEQGMQATEEAGQKKEDEDLFGCLSDEEQAQLGGYLERMIASLAARAAAEDPRGGCGLRERRSRTRGFDGPCRF